MVFFITLDSLDRIIKDKRQKLEAKLEVEVEESLKQKISLTLYNYLDFFLKKESDILAPYRIIDYKIELIEENTLSFYYLNKYSLEELVSIQEYLSSNLTKGFVVSSKAPFALLILFAYKPNRLLRFYVNYYKLNALTKKNQYPLLLIDETLAQLSKAKIFTKLDI